MLEESHDTGVKIHCRTEQRDGFSYALINVAGEVDLASAPKLSELLLVFADGDGERVVVNFEDTVFIDSSGVRALLAGRTAIEQRGGSLVIDGTSPQVARVFEILGLTEILGKN